MKEHLVKKAADVVGRLIEVSQNHERTFPADIEAVFVFSGPGTYYDKLKPESHNPDWMKWMDRDRIRAGVAIVREVTASEIEKTVIVPKVRTNTISKDDVINLGPLFVYAGIPVENEVFEKALDSQYSKLPKEKTVILNKVAEDDGREHPIRHTGDQVRALYQEISDPKSPLYGIKNIALVSSLAHFIRIPFYVKKYQDEFVANGGHDINYFAYGIDGRPGVLKRDIEYELPLLVKYAEQGDLASEPIQMAA